MILVDAHAHLGYDEVFDHDFTSEALIGAQERHGIDVHTEEIREILGDARQGLQGFRVGQQVVEVPYAFVALGSVVYNDLAKQLGARLAGDGHVITDERGETSVPGFYAAGDLVQGKKQQVYTAWDNAVDAVDSIDFRIRQLKREESY